MQIVGRCRCPIHGDTRTAEVRRDRYGHFYLWCPDILLPDRVSQGCRLIRASGPAFQDWVLENAFIYGAQAPKEQ